MSSGDGCHIVQWIEDPSRRLTMDDRDMAQLFAMAQDAVERLNVGWLIFRASKDLNPSTKPPPDVGDPLPISTVCKHQEPAFARDQGANRCLKGKRAASLKGNADELRFARDSCHEPPANGLRHREDGLVARTIVARHRCFDGGCRGQRSRREQDQFIVGSGLTMLAHHNTPALCLGSMPKQAMSLP